jgi:hypothetical protein
MKADKEQVFKVGQGPLRGGARKKKPINILDYTPEQRRQMKIKARKSGKGKSE